MEIALTVYALIAIFIGLGGGIAATGLGLYWIKSTWQTTDTLLTSDGFYILLVGLTLVFIEVTFIYNSLLLPRFAQ